MESIVIKMDAVAILHSTLPDYDLHHADSSIEWTGLFDLNFFSYMKCHLNSSYSFHLSFQYTEIVPELFIFCPIIK